MSVPFKLKYKNSAFPFKNGNDGKKEKTKEEKEQDKRERDVRMSIKRGETVPVTKQNLQQYLEYVRGSRDIFT